MKRFFLISLSVFLLFSTTAFAQPDPFAFVRVEFKLREIRETISFRFHRSKGPMQITKFKGEITNIFETGPLFFAPHETEKENLKVLIHYLKNRFNDFEIEVDLNKKSKGGSMEDILNKHSIPEKLKKNQAISIIFLITGKFRNEEKVPTIFSCSSSDLNSITINNKVVFSAKN